MSGIIEAYNLTKTYRVHQKQPGLIGSLKGLFRREYKLIQAVENISFTIQPQEMVGFLGPNGAGKTTTLKILSGLIYPTSGRAVVLGYTPWERPDSFRRQFSLIMGQKNQLWWDLPAEDSFRLHREIYSIDRKSYKNTLDELTELFDVKKLIRQPVRELSLGERMKMELIAALLHSPRLLLLDEPTIGLDIIAQITIQNSLKEYNTKKGITMLLTSHYMKDIEALCTRVLVIAHGKLFYDGPLRGIIEKFGQYKQVRLRFAGDQLPANLNRFGSVSATGPIVELKVDRDKVASALAQILTQHTIVDMSVQDPPLDQIIAKVFEHAKTNSVPREFIETPQTA